MRPAANIRVAISPVFWLNVLLVMLSIYLIAYYIVGANTVVSRTYQIKLLNEESLALTETNTALASEKFDIQDLSRLAIFAHSKNMVVADDDIAYIFEASNVALTK
ncbi:MAG: hypothetical protein Q8P35_00895 [Candidatus Yanofskybacteria bacterium]|nr:hypothetical protein [Candidatus Yanofskybacteria bacterium]